MTIELKKGALRHQLLCRRVDGTITRASTNDTLPLHDLAHYVVEKHLGLKNGFYGGIAKGFSIEELSDKEVIKTLPTEAMVAEVLTRNLQGLATPEGKVEDFLELVRWEGEVLDLPMPNIPPEYVHEMGRQLKELAEQWKN
ncbi:MAG: hypothetical protein AAFU03_14980, partial [Bacteroidota bacterium]